LGGGVGTGGPGTRTSEYAMGMIMKIAKSIQSLFVLLILQRKEMMGMPFTKKSRVMIKTYKWIICWED